MRVFGTSFRRRTTSHERWLSDSGGACCRNSSAPGPLADGTLVELAPSQPLDVPLYWQRWNLASATLDSVSDAVRGAARVELRQG